MTTNPWPFPTASRLHRCVLAKGPLRPGLGRERVIDILWMFMAPGHLLRMRRRGWDDNFYERWLADTLVAQLLT